MNITFLNLVTRRVIKQLLNTHSTSIPKTYKVDTKMIVELNNNNTKISIKNFRNMLKRAYTYLIH